MRKREVVLFFVMGSFLLSGCHTTNQDIQQNTDSTASESTSATEIDTSAMFSDRDKEVGYEEEESVAVCWRTRDLPVNLIQCRLMKT